MIYIFVSLSMSVEVVDQAVYDALFKQAVDELVCMLFNKPQQELLLSIEELKLEKNSFVKFEYYGHDKYDLSYIREENCERIQGYLRDSSFVQQHKDVVEKLMSVFFEFSSIPSLNQINEDLEKMSKFIFASPKYVEEQIALRKENQPEPFVMLGENQKLFERYSIIYEIEGIIENAHSIELNDGSKLIISMPCPMMKRNVGKSVFLSTIVWNPESFKTYFLNWGLYYIINQQDKQFPTGFPMNYTASTEGEGISIACIGNVYPIPKDTTLHIQSNVQFKNYCGNYSMFDFSLIDNGERKIEINTIPLPSTSQVELNTSEDCDSSVE